MLADILCQIHILHVQDTSGKVGSDLASDALGPSSGFAHRAFVAHSVKQAIDTADNKQRAVDVAVKVRRHLMEAAVKVLTVSTASCSSNTAAMMEGAADECTVLPNLQSGAFPCLQSPSPGYVSAANKLAEQIHDHLARQPADSPSAFYERLVNAERVVLSGNPILSCLNFKQYQLRTQLAEAMATFRQRADRVCNSVYRELSGQAAREVRVSIYPCSMLAQACSFTADSFSAPEYNAQIPLFACK